MIPTFTNRHIETTGQAPARTAAYHIDPAATGHITAILRNIYADPIKAVIREYLSNAVDAHVLVDKQDVAIQIHLPTQSEPWFSVRDFGGGLDIEATQQLLFGYGASGAEKRDSNQFIGGFGIGCKCAFSLSDSFTYTIWHGGMKRIWTCHLDDHDEGQAAMTYEAPSTDAPGVQVQIPFTYTYETQRLVQRALNQVIPFMPGKFEGASSGYKLPSAPEPIMTVDATCRVDSVDTPVQYTFFAAPPIEDDSTSGPWLLVGTAIYALDLNQVPRVEATRALNQQVRRLVIRVPIGFVQLAPSRETLQYSGMTKKVLHHLLQVFTSGPFQEALYQKAIEADPQANMLKRRQRVATLGIKPKEKYSSELGFLVDRRWASNIARINFTDMHWGNGRFSSRFNSPVDAITSADARAIPSSWLDGLIDAQAQNIVVLTTGRKSDEEVVELGKRAVSLKCTGATPTPHSVGVTILSDVPDVSQIPWLADGSLSYVEETALPEVNMQYFRAPVAPVRRTRNYNANALGTRFVQLKMQDYSSARQSDHWKKAPVASFRDRTKRVVYVTLSAYEARHPAGTYAPLRSDRLRSFVKHCAKIPSLVDLDALFGIRASDKNLPAVQADSHFVELHHYLREKFMAAVASKEVDAERWLWQAALYDIDERCKNDMCGDVWTLLKLPEFRDLEVAKRFRVWKEQRPLNAEEQAWWDLMMSVAEDYSWIQRFSTVDSCLQNFTANANKPIFDVSAASGPLVNWFNTSKTSTRWIATIRLKSGVGCNPLEATVKLLLDTLPLVAKACNIRAAIMASSASGIYSSGVGDKELRTLLLQDGELRKFLAGRIQPHNKKV